jgi:hypothetical protein
LHCLQNGECVDNSEKFEIDMWVVVHGPFIWNCNTGQQRGTQLFISVAHMTHVASFTITVGASSIHAAMMQHHTNPLEYHYSQHQCTSKTSSAETRSNPQEQKIYIIYWL